MFMENKKAYEFWNRVDEINHLSLKELCTAAEIDYGKVRQSRTNNRLMSCLDTYAIAKVLGVSIEYLITGNKTANACSGRLQAVIDILSKDEAKLDAVCTLLQIPTEEAGVYGKMVN